jgi:hypothetical protein
MESKLTSKPLIPVLVTTAYAVTVATSSQNSSVLE